MLELQRIQIMIQKVMLILIPVLFSKNIASTKAVAVLILLNFAT